jgi:hypothetical protein
MGSTPKLSPPGDQAPQNIDLSSEKPLYVGDISFFRTKLLGWGCIPVVGFALRRSQNTIFTLVELPIMRLSRGI